METNNNGAQEAQPGAVKPIWDVIGGQTDAVITTPASTEVKPNIQTEDTVVTEPIVEPIKTEPEATTDPKIEEVKTDPIVDASKVDPKVDEAKTDVLELTVADIKDAPIKYAEDSFQGLADELGFAIPEESFEVFQKTFKDNFIPKSEVDKIAVANKEKFFATLDPKIATAFDLIEMGVPQELALNPTKVQDEYLAMDNAQLVREALAAQPNWTEEMVDAQMEEISADPQKLKVKSDIVRANLTNERQNILQEQAQLVQKYTEQKQQVIIQQKKEEESQFMKALADEQAFLGVTLSKEYKEGIAANYRKGKYDAILSPAQARLRSIILLESGDKFAKAAISKAKDDGKAEIVKRLSDVPPKVTSGGGQRQQVNVADNNQIDKSPFANIPIFQ